MRFCFYTLFLIFSLGKVQAQFYENQLYKDTLLIFEPGKFSVKIDNSTFFKNNEYFGDIVEGYTLPGFWIQPKLAWCIDEKFQLEAGIHLLKFFGQNNFYRIEPVLTINYKITDQLNFRLGSLDLKKGHHLSSPIFDPERFYFNQVENGLQFQFKNSRLHSDTWLSWDRFSFYGDSIQELLTAGSSNSLTILENENTIFKLPFFILFTHRGGQLNRPKQPIETLMNAGGGILLLYKINSNLLKSIEILPQLIKYKQLTSHNYQSFSNGWAFYPSITFFSKNLYFKNSLWYSNSFVGPRGEAIYQTQTTIPDKLVLMKERTLYIPKIAYCSDNHQGLYFSFGFEGFYDPKQQLFDYNYFVQFNFSGDWLLKKMKQ